MTARIRDTLRLILSQALPLPLTELSKQSSADLTQSSWAKLIKSYSYVPEAYKDFFDPLLAAGRPFPYTVLTPFHGQSIHRTSEKLICVLDDDIYILEGNGNKLETQCHSLEGISYVEFRTALLASSLKICGLKDTGEFASSSLEFNSVTDYLFTPILNRVRCARIDTSGTGESPDPERFEHLAKVNYKFMNFARRSLMGGEKVRGSVLQPEIHESVITVLRRTYYRTISPTHMLILTDRELILIREEATRWKEDRYGGIWDYIPLDKILSLSLVERDGDLWVFSVHLPGNACFELLYQVSVIGEVKQLLDQIDNEQQGSFPVRWTD